MRKVSFALAVGFVLCACGGGAEENPAPAVPSTPVEATPPPPATTAEAPKKEEPKLTMAEMQQKAMKGMVEAMNAHDAKKLAGFYTEGAVVKVAGAPTDPTGREAIAQSYQKLFDAFSNYKTAPSRVWMKGDVVVLEWAFNGTHSGDLWGIKATEKPVGAMGLDIVWFSPEGLIKEHHVYYDGATILSQIGMSKQKARAIPQLPASPQVFNAGKAEDEAKLLDAQKAMTTALESKKEADFLKDVSDTVEYDDMTQPQTMKGKGDAKKFFKEMTTGFPDAKQAINNAWAIGDYVIAEGTMTGTHKGSFFGIPATKKAVTVHSADVMQFKDGKMVRGWSFSNGASFGMQLGLIPMPKPAADKPADKKADAKPGDKPADKKADAKPATTTAAPKK